MKNPCFIAKRGISTLVFFIIISLSGFPQDSGVKTKPCNDEIGIDVLGFIRPVFYPPNSMYNHTPNYYVTYRHYFKKSSLRMGLGGIGIHGDRDLGSGGNR